MKRWKLWIFGVLAVAGTAGGVVYAVAVAPGAKTKFEAAVLFFTAAAAVTGFLGLIVSWLSYRLEAGRVPKPDLAIVSDGELVRRWDLEIELLDPEPDVAAEVQQERQRLEAVIERMRQPAKSAPTTLAAAVLGSAWTAGQVSDEAITNYQKEVDEYLERYEEYLKERHLAEAFWARSRELVFAFTNERAGVPAEGFRAVIHIPTDDDLHVIERPEAPDLGDPPKAPPPPRPQSLFDFGGLVPPSLYRMPDLDRSLGALRDITPPGNVSPPTIRPGSTIVEFSVTEVLHNLHDDTRDHPLVLLFNRSGTWTVSYEVHARNLPQPKSGTLTLVVSLRDGDGGSSANKKGEAREG